MKSVRIVRGVVHIPTAFFAPTTFECAGLAVPSGDRSVRVVQRGETVTLTDAEADRLIERRVAIEVAPVAINADLDTGAIEISGVDVQADGYVTSRQQRGEIK
jgi:hypothetical protein